MKTLKINDGLFRVAPITTKRLLILLCGWLVFSCNGQSEPIASIHAGVVTNLVELAALADPVQPRNISIQLDGTVLWSSEAEGRVILYDATATVQLELHLSSRMPDLGDQLHLEGECAVVKARDVITLSSVPVVENNGTHAFIEKSGKVRLESGRHPVQVVWFNRTDRYGLEVEYEGPGIPRQSIPDAELYRFQVESVAGATNFVNGLDYRCCEGQWWRLLPNFDHMAAAASGVTDRFDIGVRSRDNHVGVQFSGYINIPRDGDYTFYVRSDDGSRLFIGPPSLRVNTMGRGELPSLAPVAGRGLSQTDPEFQWSEIEGNVTTVHRSQNALELELMTEAGLVRIRVAEDSADSFVLRPHGRIRAVGVSRRIRNLDGNWVRGKFFVQSWEDIRQQQANAAIETEGAAGDLPLLTLIEQVYQLSLEESTRRYPVKVRGVVTSPMESNGAVLQDSSRGIYVALGGPINLQIGDYCEIEGVTGPYEFSQYIDATRVEVLGVGGLPEPVKPSWDQLINGSLHCNYVELEGVVASVGGNVVALLTRGGRINVRLNPAGPEMPHDALGATVRLRGCLLADWDGASRRVVVGSIYLDHHWVAVVHPAPIDPFAIGLKRVGDLLQFDPQAGALQRVMVSGVLIHAGKEVCCLMDGNQGLQFEPINEIDAMFGDRVDVVGFLELGGPSPVLRAAITRKTGHSEIPVPRRLEPQDLLQDGHDSTFARVDGVLLGISEKPGKVVLELQNGLRRFVAEVSGEFDVRALAPGSRLELTGAYIGLGGNRVLGRPIDSFKLLLNSDADIVVLSRPPWWTLRRMLSLVGLLAGVLVATLVWIKLLRRKVEQRTEELGSQIRERQRVEHQREIEKERARLAHDLHDDLGARLTEVNMLASLVNSPDTPAGERNRYADELSDIALHMVTSLDEIVWAVNPRNDTVSSLAGYFGAYAQRLLELASINCGLDVADSLPHLALDPRFRQEIFLAFKEALANIIQHANARKVWLRIFVQNNDLVVIVSDDGSGFIPCERKAGSDGLVNMKERMDALNGQCTIDSDPETGTVVHLQAPIQRALE